MLLTHGLAIRRMTGALLLGLALGPARQADAASPPLGGEIRLEAFHTDDLFPGGSTRESDDGVRLSLRPEWSARVGHGLRTKLWARVVVERYRHFTDRDLERWEAGLDVKHGAHRLRLYGGTTPDELYFPSSAGGAFLDRRHVGLEARAGFALSWFALGGIEYEREDFVTNYNERDDHRWTTFLGAAREFESGRRAELSYRYRRQDSVTDLYTYGQNALRLDAEWAVPRIVSAAIRVEYALRDYRTGQSFASNFGREDDRWKILGRLHRKVVGPLDAEVFDEWRHTASTRLSKNYEVNTVGVALAASR